MSIVIGEIRLIEKGIEVWSISNQRMIVLTEDAIVEIKHTCYESDVVFVKPKQLIFNTIGFVPGLIGIGNDEWSLSYSKTKPYKLPQFIQQIYKFDKNDN